jgi:proteasome lid subunit RPN8/RPN11
MADAARAARPAEACGLLVGRWRDREVVEVTRVIPAANLLAAVPGRFELDPRVRLATEKGLRGTPERIVGHWHSHPGGPPRPSATDAAMIYEADLVWLILAMDAAGRVEAGAYLPDPTGDGFRRLGLRIGRAMADGAALLAM